MEFLTNNLSWSATSVADLYRCRWQIEVFFKQIKQSLRLCDPWQQHQCSALASLDGTVVFNVS
jgi:DDE family transposase